MMRDEIRSYIETEFLPEGSGERIDDDLDLVQTGIIDSLGLLQLIAFVETEFGITVEVEEFEQEQFKSVNSILTLLESKQ